MPVLGHIWYVLCLAMFYFSVSVVNLVNILRIENSCIFAL